MATRICGLPAQNLIDLSQPHKVYAVLIAWLSHFHQETQQSCGQIRKMFFFWVDILSLMLFALKVVETKVKGRMFDSGEIKGFCLNNKKFTNSNASLPENLNDTTLMRSN